MKKRSIGLAVIVVITGIFLLIIAFKKSAPAPIESPAAESPNPTSAQPGKILPVETGERIYFPSPIIDGKFRYFAKEEIYKEITIDSQEKINLSLKSSALPSTLAWSPKANLAILSPSGSSGLKLLDFDRQKSLALAGQIAGWLSDNRYYFSQPTKDKTTVYAGAADSEPSILFSVNGLVAEIAANPNSRLIAFIKYPDEDADNGQLIIFDLSNNSQKIIDEEVFHIIGWSINETLAYQKGESERETLNFYFRGSKKSLAYQLPGSAVWIGDRLLTAAIQENEDVNDRLYLVDPQGKVGELLYDPEGFPFKRIVLYPGDEKSAIALVGDLPFLIQP